MKRGDSNDSGDNAPLPLAEDDEEELDDDVIEHMLLAGAGAQRERNERRVWTPPSPADIARMLPEYDISAMIGRGGMGAVYRGAQRRLDRAVAVKILPSEIAESDPQFITRFENEARAMARLPHPHIVAVYDFGEAAAPALPGDTVGYGSFLYIVMELIDGIDLSRIMRSEGHLPPRRAAAIITQVCDALEFAHEHGIIHRDIKPSNVMLDAHGQVKITDFGLAKEVSADDDTMTATGTVMGTRAYMSPEQAQGKVVDHRADIYSVGAMFYEMLTGERPHGVIEPPSHRVELDVRLDSVVLKALAQDPARRYQRVLEVKSDITHITETEGAPQPGRAGRSSHRLLFLLIALLGISGAARMFVSPPQGSAPAAASDPPLVTMSPERRDHWQHMVRDYAAAQARDQFGDPAKPPLSPEAHRLIAERMLTLGGRPTLKDSDGHLISRVPGQALPPGDFTVTLLDFEMPVLHRAVLPKDELLFMLRVPGNEGLICYSVQPEIDAQVMRSLGAHHASLRWLGLGNAKLQDPWLEHLAHCDLLEAICIPRCGISDAGLDHLATLPHVSNLDVSGNAVSGAAIARMASAPVLQHVLFGRKGTQVGPDVRAIIRACPALLDLQAEGQLDGSDLAGLEDLRHLESISFALSHVNASTIDALAAAQWPRRLKLVNCQLDADAWLSVKKLTRLHTLNFIGDTWPEAATAALRSLRTLQQLELYDKARALAPQVRAALPGLLVVTN